MVPGTGLFNGLVERSLHPPSYPTVSLYECLKMHSLLDMLCRAGDRSSTHRVMNDMPNCCKAICFCRCIPFAGPTGFSIPVRLHRVWPTLQYIQLIQQLCKRNMPRLLNWQRCETRSSVVQGIRVTAQEPIWALTACFGFSGKTVAIL